MSIYVRTFTDLGFAAILPNVDGRSLAPLLHGEKVEGWRTSARWSTGGRSER